MGRILIIDDNVQILNMLRQILEREGYEVVDAINGNEGIRLYREKPTDLIITDLIMPEKNGIETIMELRRDFPDVKIIAISGGGRSHPCLKGFFYSLIPAEEAPIKGKGGVSKGRSSMGRCLLAQWYIPALALNLISDKMHNIFAYYSQGKRLSLIHGYKLAKQ